MWTIREMKEKGKAAFKANYWPCVLAALLMSLFAATATASSRSESSTEFQSALQAGDQTAILALAGAVVLAVVIGLLIKIFLANPIKLGGVHFFTENLEAGPVPVSTIKAGFHHYGHNFRVLMLHEPCAVRPAPDLTLSGHTHGGQFNCLGFTPYSIGFERLFGRRIRPVAVAGLSEQPDGSKLLVSKGIGASRIPLRVGVRPEIELIGFV